MIGASVRGLRIAQASGCARRHVYSRWCCWYPVTMDSRHRQRAAGLRAGRSQACEAGDSSD